MARTGLTRAEGSLALHYGAAVFEELGERQAWLNRTRYSKGREAGHASGDRSRAPLGQRPCLQRSAPRCAGPP